MSVYKRDGAETYSFDFQVRGHRFHGNTGESTKRAALEWEKREKRRQRQRLDDQIKRSRAGKTDFTIDEACGLYWTHRGAETENAGSLDTNIKRIIAHFGPSKRLSEIRTRDVSELIAKRRGERRILKDGTIKPLTNGAVNRTVTEQLRTIFNYVIGKWNADIPRPPDWNSLILEEPEERVRELQPEEETRILAHLREDFHPLFHFSLLTGIRQTEAITLRKTFMDWDNMVLRWRQKGNRWRTLPITPGIASILRQCWDDHPEMVFTFVQQRTRDGRRRGRRYPMTKSGLRRVWTNALKAAKVEDYKWHDNRHTNATRILRETGNLRLVQKILGHASITTTTKYAHAADDDIRKALLIIENNSESFHSINLAKAKIGGESK